MILLSLAWTLLTAALWTSVSSQILQQQPVSVLYPAIFSTETIQCDCAEPFSDVYWYRSISDQGKIEFLGRCNNADYATFSDGVDSKRFTLKRKGRGLPFTLRIVNVTVEDTGIYSCVLKDRKNETWKPGILLLPGVTPPTFPPPTTKPKPPVKPVCHCPKNNSSQEGCGYLVLWPLVGFMAALALALICTLYYFSRLPKKCRHHFVKRR